MARYFIMAVLCVAVTTADPAPEQMQNIQSPHYYAGNFEETVPYNYRAQRATGPLMQIDEGYTATRIRSEKLAKGAFTARAETDKLRNELFTIRTGAEKFRNGNGAYSHRLGMPKLPNTNNAYSAKTGADKMPNDVYTSRVGNLIFGSSVTRSANLGNGEPGSMVGYPPSGLSARLETLEPDSEVELLPGAQQPQQPPQQAPVSPNLPGLLPGQQVYVVNMPLPGFRGYQPVYVIAATPQVSPGYPSQSGFGYPMLNIPGYQSAITLSSVNQDYSYMNYPRYGQMGLQRVAGGGLGSFAPEGSIRDFGLSFGNFGTSFPMPIANAQPVPAAPSLNSVNSVNSLDSVNSVPSVPSVPSVSIPAVPVDLFQDQFQAIMDNQKALMANQNQQNRQPEKVQTDEQHPAHYKDPERRGYTYNHNGPEQASAEQSPQRLSQSVEAAESIEDEDMQTRSSRNRMSAGVKRKV